MGEQKVNILKDEMSKQSFMKSLLNDVQAFEYMLHNDWFESDITRIGAEQEMVLVDKKSYKQAPVAVEALELLKDYEWISSELAKFNLEINLDPIELKGDCFKQMTDELRERLKIIQDKIDQLGVVIVLTGILPTLRKFDLEMQNLTPKPRYRALMEAFHAQLLSSNFELRLEGIDELLLKHDSPMMEACNTSFQVHLQIAPAEFVKMYNIAQTLAGPVMAIAANSPIVFGRRLWHESRIAMFQQALDTRSAHKHLRQRSPRVHFGSQWLQKSILEIYQEDISRYRVLLGGEASEDAYQMVRNGEVPKLKALQIHNSTVYRWNRPCFGISPNGKPHLRIENRVFPAGPSTKDEMANTVFWLGTMCGMKDILDDVRTRLNFEDVRDNFEKAAKFGFDSKFNWFDDKKVSAQELICKELLPIAKEGLKKNKVDGDDIDLYLGIIEERADKHMTGARWTLRSYSKLIKETNRDEALTVITSAMIKNSHEGKCVHNWEMAEMSDLSSYTPTSLLVSEFMVTDLYTVRKDDILDLVAEMMDWRKIRHMPVEDKKGRLVGLISSRLLLRYYTKQGYHLNQDIRIVEDVMIKDPITVDPDTSMMHALKIMKENRIGCLPVTSKDELVGIITEMDFLRIAARLMERMSK